MGGPVRLDLGAGNKQEPGWVRVDVAVVREGKDVAPDVQADLRSLPFPDDFADEARAIHVIEHFHVWEAPKVLAEWIRVLKPGAELALECPCLDKIMKLFDVPHISPNMTYWGLYGDPRYEDPLMMHKWCYSESQLMRLMATAGLVNLRAEYPRFHQPIRDMRLVGVKPKTSRIELAH